MSNINPLSTAATLFRLRDANAEPTVSIAPADMRRSRRADADLEKASEQFESLLLNFMIREMRATVPESALFPQTMAEEIFTGMLDEKIAGRMAQNGGIGISRLIFNQLKKGNPFEMKE